ELLLHGIAIRPGKPVIAVRIGSRLCFGLPGNPVSALIVFDQFVRPHLRRLGGEGVRRWALGVGTNSEGPVPSDPSTQHPPPTALLPTSPTLDAVLAASVSSDPGKEDY